MVDRSRFRCIHIDDRKRRACNMFVNAKRFTNAFYKPCFSRSEIAVTGNNIAGL